METLCHLVQLTSARQVKSALLGICQFSAQILFLKITNTVKLLTVLEHILTYMIFEFSITKITQTEC
jgi:hypothetical protein